MVLLFDGNKIADPAERQKAKVEGMMLLRRCVEAEMIGGQSKIDIIFTKKDILETSPDKGRALPFVDEIKAEILSKFMGSLGTISFFSVAARPTMKPILGETYGSDFLPAWIDESPFIRTIKRDVPNTLSENSRMFLSFGSLRRNM